MESISIERYTGFSVPTRSRIFLIIPSVPRRKILCKNHWGRAWSDQHTNCINFSSFNNFKSTVTVILIVGGPRDSCTNTGVDVGVVLQQAFHGSMIKVSSMVDSGHLTWRAAKDLWFPRVTAECNCQDSLLKCKME